MKHFYEDMDIFEKSISSVCEFCKTYFYYKNFKTVTEHIADKRNDSMLFDKYKSFGIILNDSEWQTFTD